MTAESLDEVRIHPQGGYLAKRCPEAVQLDILRPVEPLPTSQFMGMLAEAGIAFEKEVFDSLRTSFAEAVDIDRQLHRTRREELTAQAMSDGAPMVIGGRLPIDEAGHRVGEPDLLLRVGDGTNADGLWAYMPVDVKHHIVREDDATGSLSSLLMRAPWVETGGDHTSESARCIYADLVQLAHYQRMLEACGHQADQGSWGGIIGRGQRLAWYDLDTPRWDPSEYLQERPAGPLSTMASYDAAFAHRLAVIDAARLHWQNPTVALLAEPILVPECSECGWRVWCYPELEAASDLSLLPGINLRKRRLHHERGVSDIHELAGLDDRTARLLAAGVDVTNLMERSSLVDPLTPIAQVIPRRRRQVALLAGEKLRAVGDLQALKGHTLRYDGSGMGDLPGQIDRGRARLGGHPAYRRRGVDHLKVPRGDIELDVDMENVEEGTYLWGVLVTRRDLGGRAEAEYLPFVSWNPSAVDGELDAFARFWEWLDDERATASTSARTLRAYCYSKGAENGQMRRIAARLGFEDQVEAFISSEQWVDLHEVFRDQLVTGTTTGLKVVAQLAGFAWHAEDAGGGLAMVRYTEAVSGSDAEIQSEARRWILEYNEDDVRATAALREWLDSAARLLPSVADIGPTKPATET